MKMTDDNFRFHLHADCTCTDIKKECPDMQIDEKSSGLKAIQDQIFNCKSVPIYNKWKNRFMEYIRKENLTECMESILTFMQELSKEYAPSTLWQAYSCLNKYYTTYKNWKNFNEGTILKSFIKSIEKQGDPKKQSLILSKEELFNFCKADHDGSPSLLAKKVVALLGYFGGLRCVELVNLEFSDFKISTSEISINIQSSKTDPKGISHFSFIVPKLSDDDCDPYEIILEYMKKVENSSGRFFRNYNYKSKKFTSQPMGRNAIAKVPAFIASFLKLEHPEKYTSHCFRRSSATALADSGASLPSLKRQFRWKSDAVAMGYIDQSKKHKMDVAQTLTITKNMMVSNTNSASEGTSKRLEFSNCSNIVINL